MNDTKSTVDPKLLEILVCPLTKGLLRYDHQAQELIQRSGGSRLSHSRRGSQSC